MKSNEHSTMVADMEGDEKARAEALAAFVKKYYPNSPVIFLYHDYNLNCTVNLNNLADYDSIVGMLAQGMDIATSSLPEDHQDRILWNAFRRAGGGGIYTGIQDVTDEKKDQYDA